MPKKSRGARDQPVKLFAILAEHTEFAELMCILRSITTNIRKSSQDLDHAKARLTVSGKPWNQIDAMVKTRWWSLFTFLDSWIFNIKTLRYMRDSPKHPNVSPELYNLTDFLIGDLECAREAVQGVMKAKLNMAKGTSLLPCQDHGHLYHKTSFTRDSGYELTFSKLPKVIQVQWEITKTENLFYFD